MQLLKQKLIGANEALKKGIFITASCLTILIVLRNSLIWHLAQCWDASKNLWSSIWAVLYWMSGENFFNMTVFGSLWITCSTFVIANIFFMVVDLTGKPAAMVKYKIQEDKGVPVNWQKYKKALWLTTFNNIVVGVLFFLVTYPLAVWRGMDAGYELPTFATTIWHFLGYVIMEEIAFYYSHRLFHHPKIYKYFHKVHHEWTAPTGIVSVYAHPLEHFVANLLPLWLGPFILGSHYSLAWLWYVVAILATTVRHSGYHLPFMPSPEAHDYHHLKFNQNYGILDVLDRLHGTDQQFRKSRNYDRHIMLFGLDSVKQLFPNHPVKEKVDTTD